MKTVDKSDGICDKTVNAHTAHIPPLDRGRGWHDRLSHGRAVLGVVLALASVRAVHAQDVVPLKDGWQLQSSAQAGGTGAALSDAGFKAAGWTTVTVPNTIVGALVQAKAPGYDFDPYWGMNVRKLPGATYPIARNYSHFEVMPDSPFAKSWWYRKTFDLPAGFRGRTVWVRFDGINYRANVWLNGKQVADKTQVVGTFRTYEWNVTPHVREGANALAVEIFVPGKTDMALTWVDWNPMPPDRNAGLFQPVSIVASGPVALRFPHVVSRVAPSLDSARLDVTVEAVNATDKEVEAQVKGTIEGITFERKVTLRPNETRLIELDADTYPQLVVKSPRLWWPYLLGKAEMYELQTEAHVGGALSDRQKTRFGIREVTQEMTPNGQQQVRVNGRPVLIRGGGWASDMMLRQDPARLETELRYVKEMNLNTVRLEGKPESDAFYEIADREGILLMTGWCCCDQWEDWKKWSAENRWVAVDSLRDQIKRLRNYPSVIMWMNSSDLVPLPDTEIAYLEVLKETRWQNTVVSSASEDKSTITGPSGVKMNGPYDYIPPQYWLEDKKNGGAFGFNTETSPGPAIPPVETLKEILPATSLWPIDKFWLFHAGGQEFSNIDKFLAGMNGRYGKAKDLTDFIRKSEAMAYDGERAMFEAFGKNRAQAPGVIQWMLNNAWPGIIWHLYDYNLRPAGGFFGTKKACEPLHVQYSYDDKSIVVVNDHPKEWKGLEATATLYDVNWKQAHTQSGKVDVGAEAAAKAFTLPDITGLTSTYFVRLVLKSAEGAEVSRNFYWLSTRPDIIDYAKHDWWGAPITQHGDFTSLQTLPEVSLDVTYGAAAPAKHAGESAVKVTVKNPSASLAFLVRLKLHDGANGPDVKPVFWEDNYFELAPGESREIGVAYRNKDVKNAPAIAVEGWNVKPAPGRPVS
jgi:exo-1,4-beta-D-glucosaminidase